MGVIGNALKNYCITYILPLFLENLSKYFLINPFIMFILKATMSFHNFLE